MRFNHLSTQTLVRVEALMRQFTRFVECGHGVRALELIRPEMSFPRSSGRVGCGDHAARAIS